jgi:hypothetical protein
LNVEPSVLVAQPVLTSFPAPLAAEDAFQARTINGNLVLGELQEHTRGYKAGLLVVSGVLAGTACLAFCFRRMSEETHHGAHREHREETGIKTG